MLSDAQWKSLANYIRSKVVASYDPATMFSSEENISFEIPHRGFYIGIVDSSGEDLVREGFMTEGLTDVKESVDSVIDNLIAALKNKDINLEKVHTSTFHFHLVREVSYLQDPTSWDENEDGVYFMWGQEYRSLYLPYQIKKMNVSKVEILDRLVCWEAGLASSLWRTPEGLIWRISCQNHMA